MGVKMNPMTAVRLGNIGWKTAGATAAKVGTMAAIAASNYLTGKKTYVPKAQKSYRRRRAIGYRRKQYKRKSYRKRKGRYRKKSYRLPLTIREEPYKINTYTDTAVVETPANKCVHKIGQDGMTLYSNFDLINRQFQVATAGSTNQFFLEWGKLHVVIQNLSPVNTTLHFWKYTFKNDQYNQTLPIEAIISQGAKNLNGGVDNANEPFYSLRQNQMLQSLGKLTLLKKYVIKPGEEVEMDHFRRMNRIFNVEKLTAPGATNFGTVADGVQGLRGYTTYYGYTAQGGMWDVLTQTGGVSGVGFSNVRLGIVVTKTYKSRAFSASGQQNAYGITNIGLGLATAGTAFIQNDESRIPLQAVTGGNLANYA